MEEEKSKDRERDNNNNNKKKPISVCKGRIIYIDNRGKLYYEVQHKESIRECKHWME